jgi:hypothetical protein
MPADDLLPWLASWVPDPRWTEWRDFSWDIDDRPLFTAIRDFNRWADDVLAIAAGNTTRLSDVEVRDPTQCRFGLWFHAEGGQRYGSLDEYRRLDVAHRELHELGADIIDCLQRGDAAAAQAAALRLSAARERVTACIDALQRAARRRAVTG